MDSADTGFENAVFTLQGSSDTLLSSQLFEFKTQLHEAVEELRIGRVAKIQYEEQISNILMEKQELAWQNLPWIHIPAPSIGSTQLFPALFIGSYYQATAVLSRPSGSCDPEKAYNLSTTLHLPRCTVSLPGSALLTWSSLVVGICKGEHNCLRLKDSARKESLSNEAQISDKRHKEALMALKKKLQVKMCTVEEEKGQFQLAAEAKERELFGLKEDMKVLQMSNYNLQKRLQEMEQKAEVHQAAKEDHMKQLGDFEKCFATISRQFEMTNEAHEKLEQNVQEAIRRNEKLKAENNELRASSHFLKEEINTLSVELKRYKMNSQERTDEEKTRFLEKDILLKELKQKFQMEAEMNKKLTEENSSLMEEKQADMRSLHKMLQLIHRHTQTILNLENQLTILKDNYQTLERDNELQRAKTTENEEKFLALQNEHKNSRTFWKNQIRVQENQHEEDMDIEVSRSNGSLLQDETGNMKNSFVTDTSTNTNLLQENGEVIMENDVNKDKVPDDLQHCHKVNACKEQKSASFKYNSPAKVRSVQESTELCDVERIEYTPNDRICSTENDNKGGSNITQCILETKVTTQPDRWTLDTNKFLSVSGEDESLHKDSRNHKSVHVTNKHVYTEIDKTCTKETDKGVALNECRVHESKILQELRDRPILDKASSKENASCDGVIALLCPTTEKEHDFPLHLCSKLNDVPCGNESGTQFKAEQMQAMEENPDSNSSDMLQAKQTSADEQNQVNLGNEEKRTPCLEKEHTSNTIGSDKSIRSDSPCGKSYIFSLEGLKDKHPIQQYDSFVIPPSEDRSRSSVELQRSISLHIVTDPLIEHQPSQKKDEESTYKKMSMLNAGTEMSQNILYSPDVKSTGLGVEYGVCASKKKESFAQGNNSHVQKESPKTQKVLGINEGKMRETSLMESLDKPVHSKDECTAAPDGDIVTVPVKISPHEFPKFKDCSITTQVGNTLLTDVSHTTIREDWNTSEQTVQDSGFYAMNCKVMGKLRFPSVPCPNEDSMPTTHFPELDSKEGGFPGTRVQDHISEIENFLMSQPLRGPMKRKMEDCIHNTEGEAKEHNIS